MLMPEHKLIKSDDPISLWAWAAIVAVVVAFIWMGKHDYEPVFTQCPQAGEGQRLIGRGHTEADGETGELMCVYSTDPIYRRMVAEK
jgi:hypothetical protein